MKGLNQSLLCNKFSIPQSVSGDGREPDRLSSLTAPRDRSPSLEPTGEPPRAQPSYCEVPHHGPYDRGRASRGDQQVRGDAADTVDKGGVEMPPTRTQGGAPRDHGQASTQLRDRVPGLGQEAEHGQQAKEQLGGVLSQRAEDDRAGQRNHVGTPTSCHGLHRTKHTTRRTGPGRIRQARWMQLPGDCDGACQLWRMGEDDGQGGTRLQSQTPSPGSVVGGPGPQNHAQEANTCAGQGQGGGQLSTFGPPVVGATSSAGTLENENRLLLMQMVESVKNLTEEVKDLRGDRRRKKNPEDSESHFSMVSVPKED